MWKVLCLGDIIDIMNERWVRRINVFWIIFWLIVFLGAAGLLIWVLSSGHRVDGEKVTETVKVESLSCESNEVPYPIFVFDDSTTRDLKILIRHEEGEVKSISLQYVLFYDDEEAATKSEAINHGAMNEAYSRDGLSPDSYSATYAGFADRLNFSIFVSEGDLDGLAKKYFMLDDLSSYEISKIKEKYDTMGLSCIEK